MTEKTHSQKLKDALSLLLVYELAEYIIEAGGKEYAAPAIRTVPPQVPEYINLRQIDIPLIVSRGIECLVYQDPRVEPSSMQADFEYYEVAIRQHNLDQPTSRARKLITDTFAAVKPIRKQQAQIQGMTTLEQVNLEIPRYYNFDSDYILKKIAKLN